MSDSNPFSSNAELIQLSKLLSYILRHGASKENIEMASNGYVKVDDLLALPKFKKITLEHIIFVVENNDKKRYELMTSPSGEYLIRASQGHTLKTVATKELLKLVEEPFSTPVIHGTNAEAWKSIKTQGLSRMGRNHIHFAVGLPSDRSVTSGIRKSSTVFIYIDTEKARKDNIKFYRSANNVILSDGIEGIISTHYFEKVVDKEGNQLEF